MATWQIASICAAIVLTAIWCAVAWLRSRPVATATVAVDANAVQAALSLIRPAIPAEEFKALTAKVGEWCFALPVEAPVAVPVEKAPVDLDTFLAKVIETIKGDAK